MTLLSICQDTADIIGLTRPAAIMTGTDQLARQFLAAAKETLEELGLMDWPVLEVAYSFPTVASQAQYSLPTDFGRQIGDTMYLGTRYDQIRGSLTPGDWARQRSTLPNVGRYRFRIFSYPSKINITPTPSTVETVVMEYQTTNRVVQADSSFKATFFDDADVAMLPENLMKKGLKWRMRRAKGLDYSEEFDDYERAREEQLAQALSFGSMPVAVRNSWDGAEIGDGYVRETGFGA